MVKEGTVSPKAIELNSESLASLIFNPNQTKRNKFDHTKLNAALQAKNLVNYYNKMQRGDIYFKEDQIHHGGEIDYDSPYLLISVKKSNRPMVASRGQVLTYHNLGLFDIEWCQGPTMNFLDPTLSFVPNPEGDKSVRVRYSDSSAYQLHKMKTRYNDINSRKTEKSLLKTLNWVSQDCDFFEFENYDGKFEREEKLIKVDTQNLEEVYSLLQTFFQRYTTNQKRKSLLERVFN